MNVKRVLGIILVIAGVALIVFSNYILNQVAEGKEKISSAESTMSKANSLFSMNPVAKQVGQGMMGGGQKKIAEGKGQVAYYEDLAGKMRMGGFASIVVGLVLFFLSFRKSRK
jgi:hypothetical protein